MHWFFSPGLMICDKILSHDAGQWQSHSSKSGGDHEAHDRKGKKSVVLCCQCFLDIMF